MKPYITTSLLSRLFNTGIERIYNSVQLKQVISLRVPSHDIAT